MSKGPITRDIPINGGFQPLQKGYVPQAGRGYSPAPPGGNPQSGHIPATSGPPPGTPPNTGSGVKPPSAKK